MTNVQPIPPASPGMVVDGDVLHDVVLDALPALISTTAAREIAAAVLAGARRAGMAVLQGPDVGEQVLGVDLPSDTDLRPQIGLMQRLAEALLTAGRTLRARQLHVAATELEYAAQSLIAAAELQREVLRRLEGSQ